MIAVLLLNPLRRKDFLEAGTNIRTQLLISWFDCVVSTFLKVSAVDPGAASVITPYQN
jgi:hypothetical protein